MRVIRIDLEYDGSGFHGFAPQPGVRTVGGDLEAVLLPLLGTVHGIQPGGRTDAGVHARGQVVSVTTDSRRPADELRKPLNALLGDDILVRSVAEAPAGFDARRSAHSRRYSYCVWNAGEPNIWDRRYMLHMKHPLNVEAMQEACAPLVGRHDFASFRTHKSQDDGEIGTVRRVFSADWRRDGGRPEIVRFDIEADAFLRHMVRVVVGTALLVGLEKQRAASVEYALEQQDRAAAGPTAPAHGLTLVEVTYCDEPSKEANS